MVAVWAVWLQVTIVYEGSVVKIREQIGEKWKKKRKKKNFAFRKKYPSWTFKPPFQITSSHLPLTTILK